ncbi:hypothetical protein EKK58_08735 [Candidatus Dependentiae bacterium]|nr:MAG: hypothetical protein EKK58_08735 [Candidatus Dependentiae bacterium]
MKLRKKLSTTLLSLCLIVSTNASAADSVKMKRIFEGTKAPFDGTLIDDEGMRQIDIEIMEKDLCERKLHQVSCAGEAGTFGSSVLYFISGMAVGALAFSVLAH